MRFYRLAAVAFAALFAFASPTYAADAGQTLVFAASSLTDALNEVGEAYAKSGKPKPVFSYASSSALARQIENGAPANIFISADEQWMDYVAERKLIVEKSRASFLGNSLVLVTPADKPIKVDIKKGFALAKLLNGGKLAMGDPESVPVGKYGKAALENLGAWTKVESNVVRADNVRSALAFVARGEAAAGIVYATDAAVEKNVKVAATFPEDSYPPVSYPVADVAGHDTPEARAFRAFVTGPQAKAIFVKYGFKTK
jgi:molybdate transport system substrate-binding protein